MVRLLVGLQILFLLSLGCVAPPTPVSENPQIEPQSELNFGSLPMEDQTGKEGQLCGPNGECDEGLTCVSQVCVNLGNVADESDGSTDGDASDESTDPNGEGVGLEDGEVENEEESESEENSGAEEVDENSDAPPTEPPVEEDDDDLNQPADAEPESNPDDENPDETDNVSDGEEGAACTTELDVRFGQGSCAVGYICVPGAIEHTGFCRLNCETVGSDSAPTEDASLCENHTTCQTMMPDTLSGINAELTPGNYAMVCLEQVSDLVSSCHALYDEDACSDGRDCQIVDYDLIFDEEGMVADYQFNELRCRKACGFEDEDVCGATETCLKSEDPIAGFDIVWEGDDPSTEVTEAFICVQADCEDEDDATFCACSESYECLSTSGGGAHCGHFIDRGWCGSAVDLFSPADWSMTQTVGWPVEKICNEVDETRLCDDSAFRENSVTANVSCVGVSSTTNVGICMAFCDIPGNPADDSDVGFQGSCPSGYECAQDLGVAMVFGPWVDNVGYVDQREDAQACDPLVCVEGTECASCGVPGAQCGSIPVDAFGNTFDGCFIPYSFCQIDL